MTFRARLLRSLEKIGPVLEVPGIMIGGSQEAQSMLRAPEGGIVNSDVLHERLRAMKARLAIRDWEVRQITHAGGVWFRFQLLLAETKRALAIDDEQASRLAARGFEIHPVGVELEPPKSLFVIAEDALPSVDGRDVPLQDAQQILLSRALVLIPFRRRTE